MGATVVFGAIGEGCDDGTATPGADAGPGIPNDVPAQDVPSVDGGPAIDAVEFLHGVASGDPLPDRVILWTRVTPRDMAMGTVVVRWEVSTTVDFAATVAQGTFATAASRDYTVKVDAGGLPAGTTLYYRFSVGSTRSIVGRTRTAPTGTVDRLRIAQVSCSSLAHGYFHVYRELAARADLDVVLHLGDYIYEFQNFVYGAIRTYEPPTPLRSLDDYRKRHAQYKRDPDLRAAHQQHPFIAIWDDHEFANDAWKNGAQNQLDSVDGPWPQRKANAMQAYFEWMPIRESADGRIWRRFVYGNLVDLLMLDTRIWGRDQQQMNLVDDANRNVLGDDQEQWVYRNVAGSTARWKVIGQQVLINPIHPWLDIDAWEGYPTARARFIRGLAATRSTNIVLLTGDFHSSWAMDVCVDPFDRTAYDPATGRGSVAVEIAAPAITSPGDNPDAVPAEILAQNPHMRYGEPGLRGYVILDVTAERVQAAWYHLPAGSIEMMAPQSTRFASAWMVRNGANHLTAGGDPAAPRANAPALAPTS